MLRRTLLKCLPLVFVAPAVAIAPKRPAWCEYKTVVSPTVYADAYEREILRPLGYQIAEIKYLKHWIHRPKVVITGVSAGGYTHWSRVTDSWDVLFIVEGV